MKHGTWVTHLFTYFPEPREGLFGGKIVTNIYCDELCGDVGADFLELHDATCPLRLIASEI